jgi:aminoglycoside/choline kinase family phosphotransferase
MFGVRRARAFHHRVRARTGSADASFRRYFRITPAAPWRGHATLIVMDAPPPMEDCRPVRPRGALMRDAGLNAPAVLADDLDAGFLLLTDLGTRTYLRGARRDVRAGALQRCDQCARALAASAPRRRAASVRPKRCSRASSRSSPTGTSRSISKSR